MNSPAASRYQAVIFDLGGVVLPSPFDAWAEYEQELRLPVGFIREVNARAGDGGAWARHERGETPFAAFVEEFEAECSAAGGEHVSGVEVMARMGARVEPRPAMLAAIRRLREVGLKVAALTNNWIASDGDDRHVDVLHPLFDVVVESAVEGLRKPDPRIYLLTCERLAVEPAAAVFLDDLGMNLKPARALGMHTIKVDEPGRALAELSTALGIELAGSR